MHNVHQDVPNFVYAITQSDFIKTRISVQARHNYISLQKIFFKIILDLAQNN